MDIEMYFLSSIKSENIILGVRTHVQRMDTDGIF